MNICISEQCRKYAFSPTVFYKWRKKFIRGGKLPLSGTLKDRCRERETENERLKKLIGELIIANDAMKKVLAWRGKNERCHNEIQQGLSLQRSLGILDASKGS